VALELHTGQHDLLLGGNGELRADALHEVAQVIVAADGDGDVHGSGFAGGVNHDDAHGNLFALGSFSRAKHIPHLQQRGNRGGGP
jgi:hypothetical protein